MAPSRRLRGTARGRWDCDVSAKPVELELSPIAIMKRIRRRLKRGLLGRGLPQQIHLARPSETSVPVEILTACRPEALVTLKVSLDVRQHDRPILEIAAPGLILKRWRAPGPAGSYVVFLQMPAALLVMRRIGHLELRALEAIAAIPFRNVTTGMVGPRTSPQDLSAALGLV